MALAHDAFNSRNLIEWYDTAVLSQNIFDVINT